VAAAGLAEPTVGGRAAFPTADRPAVIALILEFTSYPAVTDTILTTIGFIFVALFIAGLGPGNLRRI
jgi:hypothetical protein